jgi:hypothetical protein
MTTVSPLPVLQARAEARAILLAAGEIDSLDEAMGPLFEYADQQDLPDLIGADCAFAIITNAFKHLMIEEETA